MSCDLIDAINWISSDTSVVISTFYLCEHFRTFMLYNKTDEKLGL